MASASGAAQRIMLATAIAGTLDILAAIGLTLFHGRPVAGMLRFVASGPFPGAKDMGAAGAMLGLVVHYALMTIMAAAFVLAADRMPQLKQNALLWGVLYGLATYVVMNLIVVPVRFGAPLPPSATAIVTQLFCHIVLVGIPIALVTRR